MSDYLWQVLQVLQWVVVIVVVTGVQFGFISIASELLPESILASVVLFILLAPLMAKVLRESSLGAPPAEGERRLHPPDRMTTLSRSRDRSAIRVSAEPAVWE